MVGLDDKVIGIGKEVLEFKEQCRILGYIEKCSRTILLTLKSWGNNIYKTECVLGDGIFNSETDSWDNDNREIIN